MKPNFKKERELWSLGYGFICAIDEAGRGALAGPLVAGSVILKPKTKAIFNDSKLLTKAKRENLFEIIKQESVCWATGTASVDEINRYGIQTSTYLSYNRAIEALQKEPSFLLIDYYRLPSSKIPQLSITKGDRLSQSIAAASIVAKVTRDNLMEQLDKDFPQYKFSSHVGYGTKLHFDMIKLYGPSSIHRAGFIDKPSANQLNFI